MISIIPLKPFGKDLSKPLEDVVDQANPSPIVPAPTVPIFGAEKMILDGIVFGYSSNVPLTPLDAVLCAKDDGHVLQSLDAAVYVRDMLDRANINANISRAIMIQESKFSINRQVTSTFVTYWFNKSKLWMGVWDLESVYGSDLDKHVSVVKGLTSINVLSVNGGMSRNCREMRVIMKYIENTGRMMQVPKLTPVDIPAAECGNNPYMKLLLQECVGRNAEYLKRKGYAECQFFFLDARFLQHLKDTRNVGTMPVLLGGLDQFNAGEMNNIGAGTGFASHGYARGVTLGKKDFSKVSP